MKTPRVVGSAALALLCLSAGGLVEGQAALDEARARYEANLDHVGQVCAIDRDCPSPLRCASTACAEPAAMVGGSDGSTPMVLFYGQQAEAVYYLELADDPQERERGLMDRPAMLPDWGMIFVYAAAQPLSFWMRNTYIPLDMVFVDGACRVVGVVENAEPLTLDSRAVPGESQFVVELNAGEAARVGIGAGVRCELLNFSTDNISQIPGD